MKKKLNAIAGFTLAELLIVVAIIAVLVAISIPIFSSKLEASRESTDAANLRSAYAAMSAAMLLGKDDNNNVISSGTYYYTKSGKILAASGLGSEKVMKGKSTVEGWQGADLSDELPAGVLFSDGSSGTTGGKSGKKGIQITVEAGGTTEDKLTVWFGKS